MWKLINKWKLEEELSAQLNVLQSLDMTKPEDQKMYLACVHRIDITVETLNKYCPKREYEQIVAAVINAVAKVACVLLLIGVESTGIITCKTAAQEALRNISSK